jgi:hypothetical protein
MDSPSTPFALLQASSDAAQVQPARGGGSDGSGGVWGSAGRVDVAIVAPLATLKGGGAGGRMRRGKESEENTGAGTRGILRGERERGEGESGEGGEGTKEENDDDSEEEDQEEDEEEDCRFAPPDYEECRDIWQLITFLLDASPTEAADKAEAGPEAQHDFPFAMPHLSLPQDRLPSDMNPPPKREAARTKDDSGSPHAVECEGKLRSELVVWEEACIPEAMAVWLATQCGRGVQEVGTLRIAGLELEKGAEGGGDEGRARGTGKALCVFSRLVAEGKLRVVNQALVQLMVFHTHVGAATSLLLTTFQDAMLQSPGTYFSKVLSIVLLYYKRTRPLTPQNFCQGMLSAPTILSMLEGPRCKCVNVCARQ